MLCTCLNCPHICSGGIFDIPNASVEEDHTSKSTSASACGTSFFVFIISLISFFYAFVGVRVNAL